jgi:hypothetical protein
MKHLAESKLLPVIQQICHNRYPGTEGATKARTFISSQLADYSYVVEDVHSHVPNWNCLKAPSVEVTSPFQAKAHTFPAMLSKGTTGEHQGILKSANDIQVLDTYSWERLRCETACGDIAYITSSKVDTRVQPLPDAAQEHPHVIVDYEFFSKASEAVQTGNLVEASIMIPYMIEGVTDIHSIITQPPSSVDFLLVCAHYDTTFNSPGALDNGTGVAVALHLAKVFSETGTPIQFAFFDGEELNKAGSMNYVARLSKEHLGRISLVLEIDTVGAGDAIHLLCSKSLSKKLRQLFQDISLPGPCTININPQSRISFSDVWPFMQKGRKVIRMLSRAPKSSGRGHDLIHTPEDTIDKVEPLTLEASSIIAEKIVRYVLFGLR